MTTSIPSGLGTSVGYTAEVTVGTALTTSMRFIPHNKATAEFKKTTIVSQGLHQGLYEQSARRAYMTKAATVQIEHDLAARKMGLLFKHALGSSATATQMSATTVYTQQHQPGDTYGLGMTIQINKAEINGTVQQFTYSGCKVTDWELACGRGKFATWNATYDGWLEDTSTALAAVSYTSANLLNFTQGALLLGGTASGTNPVTVSSGTAPTAIIEDISIKGTNALKVDRFNLGTQVKKEQLANAYRKITGTMTLEFANLSDLYTAYHTTDTAFPLEFTLTGVVPSGGSPNHELVDVILPAVFIDGLQIDVPGPDILRQKVNFTALDDATTAPLQLVYQSLDTAI